MALCEFSKLVGGPCSASTDYPSNVACVSIGECDRDVKGQLKFCKISGEISVKNESRLLLALAGKQQPLIFKILKIYRRSGYEKHRLLFVAYVLEGLSDKSGLL